MTDAEIMAWLREHGEKEWYVGGHVLIAAADAMERSQRRTNSLQDALWSVRKYIINCDHEPAVNEIDAALQGLVPSEVSTVPR